WPAKENRRACCADQGGRGSRGMTGGPLSARPVPRERRSSRSRRSLELFLDTVFRPWAWAATLCYHAGLQGAIQRSSHVVRLAARDATAPPLRIASASDFHAGAPTHARLLDDACASLAALEPHVLLLGGDFVSVRARYIERLAPRIAAIPAPYGKFAVLGNHDLRAHHPTIVAALDRAGVAMLTNRGVQLARPFDDIAVCGLDDILLGQPDADLAFDGSHGIRVVLMHSPDGLRTLAGREFDVVLCGHTHGGQVAWPSGRPISIPGGRLNRRY